MRTLEKNLDEFSDASGSSAHRSKSKNNNGGNWNMKKAPNLLLYKSSYLRKSKFNLNKFTKRNDTVEKQ